MLSDVIMGCVVFSVHWSGVLSGDCGDCSRCVGLHPEQTCKLSMCARGLCVEIHFFVQIYRNKRKVEFICV